MIISSTWSASTFSITPAPAVEEILKTAVKISIPPPVTCAMLVLGLVPTATAPMIEPFEPTSTTAVLKRDDPLPLTYVNTLVLMRSRKPHEKRPFVPFVSAAARA